MTAARDPLRGAWLARRLRPARVLIRARLGSTNQTASLELERGRLTAPAVVLASLQTAGRGQRTHRWWSDAGSLCVTLVLPAAEDMPVGQVPLRAGLAVASVVNRHVPGSTVGVKWPNDVLIGDTKVAGLLCARQHGADLIGIGVNVRTDFRAAPSDVRCRATSLARHMRKPPRRDELLAELWQAMRQVMIDDDWFARYPALHILHGRPVGVEADGRLLEGRCRGIDRQGRLLLEHEGRVLAVANGTVLRWSFACAGSR